MLSIEDAQRALEPYDEMLADVVYGAWDCWPEVAGAMGVPAHKRTRAGVIYNVMAERAKIAFEGVEGIAIVEEHESILVSIGGILAVRLKKLNGALRPSNYPTPRQMEFGLQLPLPGVPDGERILVGYVPDLVGEDITVHVVYVLGNRVEWSYTLERPVIGREHVKAFPGRPDDETGTGVSWTFTPKEKESKRKTQEND